MTNVSPGAIYTTLYDNSLSVTCGRCMVISGYSRILHQKNTDYNWNIIESGVKHHNPLSGNTKSHKRWSLLRKRKFFNWPLLLSSNLNMLKVASNTITIIIVVYSVQYYVIKFVRSVVFSRYINTTERHDITDDDWWFLVFNATFTFSYIMATSLVEEAGVPGENHRPRASNWYTVSLAAAHFFAIYKTGCTPMPYWWKTSMRC
jgi:hypothetical protein